MSADGRTSAVMRGIRHGACDYLIKPIREEELKNIWQHVVRKRWNENKEHEHSGSLEDNDRNKRGNDDTEYASSVNEGAEGLLKTQKKRRDAKEEDDGDLENDDPATAKKPRVVWSVELHQQFVSAVNQLGIDSRCFESLLLIFLCLVHFFIFLIFYKYFRGVTTCNISNFYLFFLGGGGIVSCKLLIVTNCKFDICFFH